ncbi:MAG: hypothetical protein KBA55_07490 [Ruminococcus sp.]|nr:hypothetical protein [Ruminococcus sp.]
MKTENLTRHMKRIQNEYFKTMITAENIMSKINKLEKARPSQVPSLRNEIFSMLSSCNISFTGTEDAAALSMLVRAHDCELLKFDDIEQQILKLMYSYFMEYPSPSDYMKRIVNRLSDPADRWENDPLRLRILKQFIKYGDFLSYKKDSYDKDGLPVRDKNGNIKKEKVTVYGGGTYIKSFIKNKTGKSSVTAAEIINELDDSIFECLKGASKEQKQYDGKFGLIRLADDLACGKFRSGGSTRRDLYMFAIVFNMTYSCNSEDPYSGIEKNLFKDYYTNNLMRFFTSDYCDDKTAFESEPSGQGINYKNFAEMIFIYYISKDLAPVEKLRRANEMIGKVTKTTYDSVSPMSSTTYYVSSFEEKLINMSEDEFLDHIKSQYNCSLVSPYDKSVILNPFQVQISQRTAYNRYVKMIRSLASIEEKNSVPPNYGVWFTDVCALDKYGSSRIRRILSADNDEENDKTDRFIELLRRIHSVLGINIKEDNNDAGSHEHKDVSVKIPRLLEINSPEKITRNALITAFYYYYNNEKIDCDDEQKTLWEVFNDYKSELDPILESANFQPVSEKNIFDIAVIFSSYAYFNN